VGWLNSPEGHDFLIRRSVAFGPASVRYFKRAGKEAKLAAKKK
jgi:hypothetical protein